MSATYAAAQRLGTRSHQCDATAVRTVAGTRAYVLLDGIGSSDAVRDWTRATTRNLATAAARSGHAEATLRGVRDRIAAAREKLTDPWDRPSAVAVVALHRIGSRSLSVAWCGDARAYLYQDGCAHRLTTDHNMRQERLTAGFTPRPGDRNLVTSCLGSDAWAPIGSVTTDLSGPSRLLLASDGCYEPIEDAHRDMGAFLYGGTPTELARHLVNVAVDLADPTHTDNATALVANLETR